MPRRAVALSCEVRRVLAALLTIWTEMYLSRRLSGRTQFGVDDLFAIAGALDMSVPELLDLAESATKPRTADADGASGVATGRVELPTFRFSVERSTS